MRLNKWIWVYGTLVAGVVHADADADLLLADVFQNHAVLQRDQPIAVWGDAAAGDEVTVALASHTAHAVADAAGHWRAQLPPLNAGGPYSLTARIRGGSEKTIDDVLLGDVWLCSGQSNMEFPVARALNAADEIAHSTNDSIRLLTVTRAASAAPLTHFKDKVAWSMAGPATVADFSAACYFFARDVARTQKVPQGLIHASFGGSRIEPWMSARALHAHGGFEPGLELLRTYALDPAAGNARFGESWERWWHQHAPASTPWNSSDRGDWRPVPEPLRDWKTWGVAELAQHDGMVWFRRAVTLTAAEAARSATLSIGAIDEVDETWVNGHAIANSFGWGTERTYSLPTGILHAGENLIAINVLSTWDAGGMYGPAKHLALHFTNDSQVSLAGQWQYQFVPESMGLPPRAPWETISGLSSLYDAMIAPLGPLGLRGALWYQGESNAGEADRYQSLLAALMTDWRGQFGRDLPFLVVQLPNFGSPRAVPVASPWAALREAQRAAVAADAHAALAVTIDVGDAHELHPPNKQAVGARLALAARQLVYGEANHSPGPTATAARRTPQGITISFMHVDGALVTYSAAQATGFELCGDTQESCRFVAAVAHGTEATLDSASIAATHVRFCWADAPLCNLYDAAGAPAGPFDLRIEPPVH